MSDESGIKISVTGAKGETSFTKDLIAADIRRNAERWEKFSGIKYLNIVIERHESAADNAGRGEQTQPHENRVKYSVKAEATGDGSYHADAHDWSLEKAMHDALGRLDAELLKKKEKAQKGRFRKLFSRNA